MDVLPPEERYFYKVLCICMDSTSLGADYWSWYKRPKKIQLYLRIQGFVAKYFSIVCFSSQILFLMTNFKKVNKSTLAHIYSLIPIGFVVNVKMVSARCKSYDKIIKDYMEKIHLYNYYCVNRSEFVKMKLIQMDRASQSIGLCLVIIMLIDWLTWMIAPVINSMKNMDAILNKTDNFQTCCYLWMPFEYLHDYHNWIITYCINAYVTFIAITIIVTFDIINYTIIFHLIGHIQILKYKIRTIHFDELNNEEIKLELVDVIRYHAFIIKIFEDVEAAFGLNVAGNYIQNLFEDGLLLYQFMLGDKDKVVVYGLMILIYMGGLILMSLVLEEIRKESEDLPETVYSIPWENMSLSNQKIVILILARVQPILQFQAAGGFKAGVMPAISIIKTTFSYYIMIKARM